MEMNAIKLNIDTYDAMRKELGVLKTESVMLKEKSTSTNTASDAIKKAFMQGYSKGHNDTVESGNYCPEESADDWLSEQHP